MLPRRTPDEAEVREHWTFVSPKAEEEFTAYLAGQPWWFECHKTPTSKPCLEALTSGELACSVPHCKSCRYWFGYTPLIRETDYKPVTVGLYGHLAERVRRFRRLQRVTVGRGNQATDPVFCVSLGNAVMQTASAVRRVEPDLTGHLLSLWKMAELEAWLRARGVKVVESARSAAPSGSSSGVAAKLTSPAETEAGEEILRQLMASQGTRRQTPVGLPSVGEVIRNGKHR